MGDHYFSTRPTSNREEHKVEAVLLGNRLFFHTDNGVFSKKGVDFGSRLLIESVFLKGEVDVLDLGCGYGVIGISLAKANPKVNMSMVDINERAVQLVIDNVKKNGLQDLVNVYQGDGFSVLSGRVFDHILLNPPIRAGKKEVYHLFENAKNHLKENGQFWIVIRKRQGAESAVNKLRKVYSAVEVVKKNKGYWVIRSQK